MTAASSSNDFSFEGNKTGNKEHSHCAVTCGPCKHHTAKKQMTDMNSHQPIHHFLAFCLHDQNRTQCCPDQQSDGTRGGALKSWIARNDVRCIEINLIKTTSVLQIIARHVPPCYDYSYRLFCQDDT